MPVFPIRWQGTGRIEGIRKLLAVRAREWARDWAAIAPEMSVSVLDQEAPAIAGPKRCWHVLHVGQAHLHASFPPDGWGRLGCQLLGLDQDDGLALASGVGRRAFESAMQLLAGGEGEAAVLDGIPAPEMVRARCGVAAYRWTIGSFAIDLYLDAGLCEALLPRHAPDSRNLVSRGDAILENEVTLPVMLQLGSAVLADTIALRPGEVIKSSVPLDARIGVAGRSGAAILSGALVAEGGMRALRCSTGPSNTGGNA